MTTLQKIKNLTWWNEISKLKSILTDLLANSGGGGAQDLQSVFENGGTVGLNSIDSIYSIYVQNRANSFGSYTLATLDDFDRPLPTYANNAAAISGGLVVNKRYKTATREVRIVV